MFNKHFLTITILVMHIMGFVYPSPPESKIKRDSDSYISYGYDQERLSHIPLHTKIDSKTDALWESAAIASGYIEELVKDINEIRRAVSEHKIEINKLKEENLQRDKELTEFKANFMEIKRENEKELSEIKRNISAQKIEMNNLSDKLRRGGKEFEGGNTNVIEIQHGKSCIIEGDILSICGLNKQLDEEIISKNWTKVAEIIKENLCSGSQLNKQLENIEGQDDFPLKAAEKGYNDIIKMLLCHGLPVNGKYYRKHAMLHEAAWKEQYDTVKLLITEGADVNLEDEYGSTPLHWASISDNLDVVKILIQNGAEVHRGNWFENYPIHWAAEHGKTKNVEYLLNNGADVNVLSGHGQTPLSWAAKSGQLAAVKLLFYNGGDISIKDLDGLSAFDLAKEKGYNEVVEFLESVS